MSNQVDIAIYGVVNQRPLRELAATFRWKIGAAPVLICRQDHAETVRMITDSFCQTATGLLDGNPASLPFLTACLNLGDPVYVLRTTEPPKSDTVNNFSYFPPTHVPFAQLGNASIYPIGRVLCISKKQEQELPQWVTPS